MNRRILIVEDEFIVADDLQLTLEQADYEVCGIAGSTQEARAIIEKEEPGLVLLDIQLKGQENGIQLGRELKAKNIAFIYISANSNWKIFEAAEATEPYGFLIKPFSQQDLFVTLEIAYYRHEHNSESKWRREEQIRGELEAIALNESPWQEKMLAMTATLQKYISFDGFTGKFKRTSDTHFCGFGLHRKAFDIYEFVGLSELSAATGLPLEEIKSMLDESPNEDTLRIHNGIDFLEMLKRNPLKAVSAKVFGFLSSLTFPIFGYRNYEFSITFFCRETFGYSAEQAVWIAKLRSPIAAVLAGITEDEKSKQNSVGPDRLRKERSISRPSFSELIGSSSSFLHIMDLVDQVAPLETVVLLSGETGTGKDRIAGCIHQLSPRAEKPFIKVNCADILTSTLEKRTDGKEHGTSDPFFGTLAGKFEQANGGSIYLDEIGELPPELQFRLLRILQDKAKGRIKGIDALNINVRIIASTNRNLESDIAMGRFRLDLYYRLNVFPINLLPLRERKEDIKSLSNFFVSHYASKMKMQVPSISKEVSTQLESYNWPGNIRELENIIEKSVSLSNGKNVVLIDSFFI